MRFHIFLVLIALTLIPGTLLADRSKLEKRIKKYVFEGCAKAEADTAKLSEADKQDLVVYLGRVLELKLGGATNVLQDAVKFSRPTSSIPVYNEGGELWRTFDPNHERQAKQCALKILSYVNRNAISELAKVLSYAISYHDTGAEREVEEIVSVARHIMRRAMGIVSPELEERALTELFELRAETKFPLIDEFAAELAAVHPELLAEELMQGVRERRLYAVRLASRLGLGSRAVGEQLLNFYRNADLLRRRDIATTLAGYESDEIRLAFIQAVVDELEQGKQADGDILNSFGYAVKSLPPESLQKFSVEQRQQIEKLYFAGKYVGVLEPLISKFAEAGLISADTIRSRVASADPKMVDLIERSSFSNAVKNELYLLVIEAWMKIPLQSRPNGVAVGSVLGLQQSEASQKQINKAVVLLSAEIEELLKRKPKEVPSGYREQIEAIGVLGGNSFRLIPKPIVEASQPELQEALVQGMVGIDKLDPRSIAYIKQVLKSNPAVVDALKEQERSGKIVIEQFTK